ncbi:MAG: ATP-binding protein [Pseudomonadota bacterium]
MNSYRPYQVVYLTGAPATGKSTLTANLLDFLSPLKIFAYSKVLADFISQRIAFQVSEDNLREQSAQIITADDIKVIDNRLLEFIKKERLKSHIIIDSHAVTKESYGFRVTPFSMQILSEINPTLIIVLYTEGSVAIDRIKSNNQGRPLVSLFEADFHTNLQSSVALLYATNLGIPIYFFDSNKPAQVLVQEILAACGCNKAAH